MLPLVNMLALLLLLQWQHIEVFLVILIANSRYLIMSCALSQKLSPDIPWYQRILIGFDIQMNYLPFLSLDLII